MDKPALQLINISKIIFVCLLGTYGIACAKDPAAYHMIDGVNLVAHEAGHLLLGYFGEFIGVLGGTIGQLFAPAALTVYFIMQKSLYSSTITLFWVGQNMLNISIYIKDASAMELPLVNVGGGEVIHDWNYLLLKFGMLSQDRTIGNMVYGLGLIIMLSALILGIFFSLDKQQKESTSTT